MQTKMSTIDKANPEKSIVVMNDKQYEILHTSTIDTQTCYVLRSLENGAILFRKQREGEMELEMLTVDDAKKLINNEAELLAFRRALKSGE